MGILLALLIALGDPLDSELQTRQDPLVGLTQQRVEAILGEEPTIFMLCGGIGWAKSTCVYANSHITVVYSPSGRVETVMRHK